MDVNDLHKALKKIKLGLVFFCFVLVAACQHKGDVRDLHVDYEQYKAVGITFKSKMDTEELRVFVGKESEISVIGVIVSLKDKHTFTPAIPFTAGQTYSIRKGDKKVLATFRAEQIGDSSPPELLAIYPTQDSVPENLLKMYLQFSRPMQEAGSALDFISVRNNTDNISADPFLKLETELWNKEHSLLTLWFDPGRIKTDLIPNRKQGLPLVRGKKYTILIKDGWKAANGQALAQTYTKELFVQKRDMQKPKVEDWKLTVLEKDPNKSLHIEFGETMDAFLAREAIGIYDSQGSEIGGLFKLENKETALKFVPTKRWSTGDYEIRVQSRLEDLAGNNLNRLFDIDLTKVSEEDTLNRSRRLRFKVL